MENREILVANTKTQRRDKITTNATTLGELKAAFSVAGIDYSGMTFTEGISKTQLLDDATQLPQNLMYKGQPTNNLVILLTNTKKNISSGIDRKEVYKIIKDGNLQEDIKKEFGRNFTQVSTEDLCDFIGEHIHNDLTEEDFEDLKDCNSCSPKKEDTCWIDNKGNYILSRIISSLKTKSIDEALFEVVAHLACSKVLDSLDVFNLKESLDCLNEALLNGENPSEPVSTSDGRIKDADIDTMIDEMNA